MSRDRIITDLMHTHARALKMPGLARSFQTLARQARAEGWSPEEYLHEVLSAEIASRSDSGVRHRIAAARFPETKTKGEFDFTAADGIDADLVMRLARGDWITAGENVVLAGPLGTGKTHIAIALGVEACRQRRHVAFHRAAELVRTLVEARNDRALGQLQCRLHRVDLVILDKVGFIPFDRLAVNSSSTSSPTATRTAAPSWSPPTSPSPSGQPSSAATRSSPQRFSTASPNAPPYSPREAGATACEGARPPPMRPTHPPLHPALRRVHTPPRPASMPAPGVDQYRTVDLEQFRTVGSRQVAGGPDRGSHASLGSHSDGRI